MVFSLQSTDPRSSYLDILKNCRPKLHIIFPTGKIIGACCACSGVPLIAIPLPIISQKFDVYYRRYCKRMEKRSTRKDNERLGVKWVSYLDRPFFDTDRYMADVIDDAGPAWGEKKEQKV